MRPLLLVVALALAPAVAAAQQADSTLLRWIGARPDAVRDSLNDLIAATGAAEPAAAARLLARAKRLGAGYLAVWRDPFPLADVRRFAGWSGDRRALRLRADSLRRAGNAALGEEGLAAALRDWRASFRAARELSDTATMAAALGNIGAGFHRFAELDSAQRYFAAARHLSAAAGDRRTMVNAMGGLASLALERDDLASARQQYTATLALRRQLGDYRGVAADANNLGLLAEELGNADEARRRYTEALITAREHELDEAAAAPLVNLAALASSDGDDAIAQRRYEEALALYRRLGDSGFEALVLHDLGLVEAGRGNYPEAAAHYRAALALLEPIGPPEDVVAAQMDLALVLAAMGQLDPADAQLREAERIARESELDEVTRGRLLLTRGSLAEQLNRLAPARAAYLDALTLFTTAGDPTAEADALSALGGLSLRGERYAAARDQLVSAAARQEVAGDRRAAALSRLLAARAVRELGDTAAARRLIAGAAESLRESGDHVGEAWGLCEAAELQRTVGLPLAAERTYRRGVERLGRRPVPEVAACLYGGLAATLRSRGAQEDAIAELQRGIAATELAAGYAVAPGRRADYLSDKWDLYSDLALAQRAAGDAAGAFETSERGRARHTLDRLAHGTASDAVAIPPAARALRRRITALMSGATPRTGVALRGADALERLPNERREALAQAQEAYAAIVDSLESAGARAPRSAAPVPGWRAVAARLPADAALIEYLVTDSAAVAFVVTSTRVVTVDLPVTGVQLATAVDFLRGLLTAGEPASGERGASQALRRLGAQLITPIEAAGLLAGKRRLLLVPHRELHYLPFAALADVTGRHLIERYELSSASSAAIWLRLATASPPAGTGMLALAPLGRELPGAEAEVTAIARMYGEDATLLRGSRATRAAFAAAAPRYGIIHLATLGVLNRHNPLFSFVTLAPSPNSDGRLEVHDLAGLRLNARLVVLSACQTGLGAGRLRDVPHGDDWVGLVGAFHAAGASRVLATLWPVHDGVTAQLMSRFYTELRAGRSESASLAIAQRTVLADPRTQSPFYWAGFVLDGSH